MRRIMAIALGLTLGLGTALTPALSREAKREASGRHAHAATHHVKPQRGRASYYSNRFHGRRMANGERFNRHSNSAASRTLPLGTQARVRNLENGRTAIVTIRDRGPHKRGRVLDVSPQTATQLGMRQKGTAMVEIVPLGRRNDPG